ncbi:hypothetical protein [Nostoc piscinale]|uniref:hypothetical protein n=1 Tax=Nostoc piscinale TaxID=224012 RepID=UPI0039A60BFE
MTRAFKVDFSCPEHGWITVEMFSQEQQLLFSASYTPENSLCELLDALIALLNGQHQAVVRWNTEPIRYEFIFAQNDKQLTLDVVKLANLPINQQQNELVFKVKSSCISMVLAFWRALRHLESYENFAQHWVRSFPKREMRLLEKSILEVR